MKFKKIQTDFCLLPEKKNEWEFIILVTWCKKNKTKQEQEQKQKQLRLDL